MTEAPLLDVADLAVHFTTRRRMPFASPVRAVKALDGVSFMLGKGETLGIVGESGCGKSTLCRAVLRLVEPTSGRMTWRGRNFLDMRGEKLRLERRHMQLVFQDPLASLDPRMTIGDIVERPLLNFPQDEDRTARRRRVAKAMELVGLDPNLINRYPHEFSGGQCQRVGIARAMILNPKLIVCDEPVSALDVSVQAQIINLLKTLQAEFGISYLFISHNLSVVRHISHRVMVLYLGKVVEMADRDAFFRGPLHPYSKALISAVPLPDPLAERRKKHVRLQGDLPSPLDPPSGCPFRTRCPAATEICISKMPPLRDFGDGHLAACHHIEPETL